MTELINQLVEDIEEISNNMIKDRVYLLKIYLITRHIHGAVRVTSRMVDVKVFKNIEDLKTFKEGLCYILSKRNLLRYNGDNYIGEIRKPKYIHFELIEESREISKGDDYKNITLESFVRSYTH